MEKSKTIKFGTDEVEVWPESCVDEQNCIQCYIDGKIRCAPRFRQTTVAQLEELEEPKKAEKPLPLPPKKPKERIRTPVIFTDKNGRQYHKKPGRPRTGENRPCIGCGIQIYVSQYRIKEKGNYCQKCVKKFIKPPPHKSKQIQYEIKELAVHSNKHSNQEIYSGLINLLFKHLKRAPVRTVKCLLPGAKTYTSEQLIKAAVEILMDEMLRFHPEFEEVADGIWRLKGG